MPTCHSTNDIAATLFKDYNVIEGTTVVTAHQTAGRGQRGNTWEAEPFKNLTFSLLLKPVFLRADEQFRLNMAVSVALVNFLSRYIVHNLKIKWPNDIYVGDKKLGGILIESALKSNILHQTIVGIGLNINQETFSLPKATSLKLITGQEYNLEQLLSELLASIEEMYLQLKAGNFTSIQNLYLKNLYLYKEKRSFRSNATFEGIIVGVDAIGRLAVEVDGEVKYYFFKEIEFI